MINFIGAIDMGRRLFRSILFPPFLIIVVVNFGCIHSPCHPQYTGLKERREQFFQYYSYPKEKIEARRHKTGETKNYSLRRVEFPHALKSEQGNDDIRIDYYQVKKGGKLPTIIISPIFGERDIFSRYFARYFASHGFHCAIVHEGSTPITDVEEIDNVELFFKNTIIKIRQVVDWLTQQEEVDQERLGSFGISFGAVKNVITAGVEPRLKCHVFALAGGSLADIVCYSKMREIRKWRKRIRKKEDISLPQLHQKLSQKIRSDPLTLGEYVDATKTLTFIAVFDRVIPGKYAKNLWQALGKPEVIYLPFGHFASMLTLPYTRVKSLQFFQKCFGVK